MAGFGGDFFLDGDSAVTLATLGHLCLYWGTRAVLQYSYDIKVDGALQGGRRTDSAAKTNLAKNM